MKYLDDEIENLAFNIYCFEKNNIVYAVKYRLAVQDIPQIILSLIMLPLLSQMEEVCLLEDGTYDSLIIYISLLLSVLTSLLSLLQYMPDYLNREASFLKQLAGQYHTNESRNFI